MPALLLSVEQPAAYSDSDQARRASERNHVSYRLSPYGINLPSGLQLTKDDVDRASSVLKSADTTARRGHPSRLIVIESVAREVAGS